MNGKRQLSKPSHQQSNASNKAKKVSRNEQSKQVKFHTGIVCKWSVTKGFGFITSDDGSGDVFVHHSEINDGESNVLFVNQAVKFQIVFSDNEERKGMHSCVQCIHSRTPSNT